MKKIRFGIVGVGNQGTYYAQSLFAAGEIENGVVSAICDVSDAKINAIKEKLNDDSIVYFHDYKEMVKSGLCDAVLVETPHYSHTEIVIYCLENGMPVICEKPAGVYTKEVREMNEVAARCNTKFGMMFNQRTNCVYRKMREIIADGG
ncbi:MAG: Gfo/Idh/MocA family oxidoreductase, partial [Clostridia bacterium]|nr:Gfo/Idh/MocA family oxidoreductase [Clostridia bacterium]